MAGIPSVRAVFIDLDNTLIRPKPGSQGAALGPYSLFDVLQRAGVELRGLHPAEVAKRIQRVREIQVYWHWSDFIVALGLDPGAFWEYAYRLESAYLEPTGPELQTALEQLRSAGLRLYVTSNNPSSGILHKLRLVGLGDVHGAPMFCQFLGSAELHAMKWESEYWLKALAHTGWSAHEVAVIGDSIRDDAEIPRLAGIRHCFILLRGNRQPAEVTPGITYVRDLGEVVNHLLGPPANPQAGNS